MSCNERAYCPTRHALTLLSACLCAQSKVCAPEWIAQTWGNPGAILQAALRAEWRSALRNSLLYPLYHWTQMSGFPCLTSLGGLWSSALVHVTSAIFYRIVRDSTVVLQCVVNTWIIYVNAIFRFNISSLSCIILYC